MYKILIIDDSFIRIDAYKKAFEDYKKVEIVEVLQNIKKMKEFLDDARVDLIAYNIENPLKNDVKKIKKLSNDKNIPIIFMGNLYADNKLNIVDKKTIMVKRYIDRAMVTKRNETPWLIVIGSSTGGPRALQQIIPKLPNDLNGIILVVQHMPANFTASLAERLNLSSAMEVKEAEHGEDLKLGTIYIAPGDYHMKIKDIRNGYKIELNEDDKIKGLRPAVDVLMNSVSQDKRYNKMGVILTGMGNDGADGVKMMKKASAYNIIQDEASCVIYGMPRAAYETNCIDEVVELNKIAENILLKVGCKNGFRY